MWARKREERKQHWVKVGMKGNKKRVKMSGQVSEGEEQEKETRPKEEESE